MNPPEGEPMAVSGTASPAGGGDQAVAPGDLAERLSGVTQAQVAEQLKEQAEEALKVQKEEKRRLAQQKVGRTEFLAWIFPSMLIPCLFVSRQLRPAPALPGRTILVGPQAWLESLFGGKGLDELDSHERSIARRLAQKLDILAEEPGPAANKNEHRRARRRRAWQIARQRGEGLSKSWAEDVPTIVDEWPITTELTILQTSNFALFDKLVACVPRDFHATAEERRDRPKAPKVADNLEAAEFLRRRVKSKNWLSAASKDTRAAIRMAIANTRETGYPTPEMAATAAATVMDVDRPPSTLQLIETRIAQLVHKKPRITVTTGSADSTRHHCHGHDHSIGHECCRPDELKNPLPPARIGSLANLFDLATNVMRQRLTVLRGTSQVQGQEEMDRLTHLVDLVPGLRTVFSAGLRAGAMEHHEPLLAILSLPVQDLVTLLHERFFIRGGLLRAFIDVLSVLNVVPGVNFGNAVFIRQGICP